MLKLILFTLFLSANVSALNFQKAHTGTFESNDKTVKPVGEAAVAQAAFGTFDMTQDLPRSPASVGKEKPEEASETRGTFGK